LNYPVKEGVTYLLGCCYAPLRSEFRDVPEKEIREDVRDILITFGGEDPRGLTPAVVRFLNEARPGLRKKVVIGGGFKDIKAVEKLCGGNTELVYNPSAREMKEAMLSCDAAVSAGGQTLYEAARVGMPTVAVAVAENQMDNIEGWQRAGFIRYAGWWEDKGLLDNMAACLDSLKDRGERLEISMTGRSAVDGKGAARAVSAVMDILKGIKR
ncbi:MAG: UDP-2,4-diacetamido-2,4,6-trideoxy-beta-L-altropyranose hydrolase, partial [Deltaproteobacteria bacterium]|nr:UDP-2,4-diacetamido-2,4,6-trideoxy-beta-L-altropyranose hydrolase [Deltaproteobacteria bacterium]